MLNIQKSGSVSHSWAFAEVKRFAVSAFRPVASASPAESPARAPAPSPSRSPPPDPSPSPALCRACGAFGIPLEHTEGPGTFVASISLSPPSHLRPFDCRWDAWCTGVHTPVPYITCSSLSSSEGSS